MELIVSCVETFEKMSDGIDMMNTENIFVHQWSMSQFHEQRLSGKSK